MRAFRLLMGAAVWLLAVPAPAQQAKTVDGTVINFGLMTAEQAIHAVGHSEAHPAKFPSGSQHVLITLADAKSGQRIGDADVTVEVVGPQGRVEKKPLLHTSAAGMPDYSELFVFGGSGTYTLRLTATRGNAKPLKTTFTIHYAP